MWHTFMIEHSDPELQRHYGFRKIRFIYVPWLEIQLIWRI